MFDVRHLLSHGASWRRFTFFGFTFRARGAYNQRMGEVFTGFLPAVSPEKLTAMSRRVASVAASSAHDPRPSTTSQPGVNLVLRGWFGYFTVFYPTAVIPLCQRIDRHLVRWARWKYKRLAAQRSPRMGVVVRGPLATGSRGVRALAILQRSVLTAGRHEPYESRGSRADLWGPAGEIPAGYPADSHGRRFFFFF